MIVIYEIYAVDDIHVPFNAGLIETAALAFPYEIVRFYAEVSHLRHVEAYLSDRLGSKVEFREIDIPDQKDSNLSHALKIYNGLQKIKQDVPRGSLLILSYITPISLAVLKFFMCFRRYFCGAQVILHGNLAEIDDWRSRNLLFRYWNLKGALSFFNLPRLRYVILEPSIAREVLRRMPALEPFMDVLPHPVPSDQANSHPEIAGLSQPVTIGYLGLVTILKGFPVFKGVAKTMKGTLGEKVRFLTIGHTKGRPIPDDIDCLDVKPKASSVSREEFIRLAVSCHFICLPFSDKLYSLSPSGTLLDAVVLNKPVIALDVPVIRDLFAHYGDIGYICSTPEEMCQTIEQIVQTMDIERYQKQQAAITGIVRARQPIQLANTYLKITERIVTGSGLGALASLSTQAQIEE